VCKGERRLTRLARYIHHSGFYIFIGIALAILAFLYLYRGQIAIEKSTGKVVAFKHPVEESA
jgi:hypothetical protein